MTQETNIPAMSGFDPGQQVPDEYDIFCEACGYSLAGLAGDRCPECGVTFDPKELPFARIPWLHRRRLGKFKAYVNTVRMVCFRPARFARELCRPVRISATDAKSFRRVTLWIVTVMFLFVLFALPTTILLSVPTASRFPFNYDLRYVLAAFGILAAVGLFHLFLRLATDMPLFIWKGLPSMAPTELAPIHHYACAPLVFAAILMPVAGYVLFLRVFAEYSQYDFYDWINIALVAIALAWIWIAALVLMRVSMRASMARMIAFAIYLPIHWLMMFGMSLMLFAIVFQIGLFIFEHLH